MAGPLFSLAFKGDIHSQGIMSILQEVQIEVQKTERFLIRTNN